MTSLHLQEEHSKSGDSVLPVIELVKSKRLVSETLKIVSWSFSTDLLKHTQYLNERPDMLNQSGERGGRRARHCVI